MLRQLLLGIGGAQSIGWPPADYYSARFAYARQMEDAARGLQGDWLEVQRMLQGIWQQDPAGLTWAEARPAIYYAWRLARYEIGGE
jgi:hypothetical protein